MKERKFSAPIPQALFLNLAKDPDITLHQGKVFMYMVSKINTQTFTPILQIKIAKELGIGPSKVSKAIMQLCEKGILETTQFVGKSKGYRFIIPPTAGPLPDDKDVIPFAGTFYVTDEFFD